MARKKSRFSMFAWMLFSVISGGGVGGFLNPDWPIVGPLIKSLLAQSHSHERLASDPHVPVTGPNFGGADLSQREQHRGAVTAQLASSRKPTSVLLIASFNIQVLGKSKMSKPGIVEILAHVIRQFDVVAVQEVRAKEDNIIPALVAAVNANGSRYSYLIGPRLGRTVSTEQYAFIFDTQRIEHDPSAVGTITDPEDMLHREPFTARFRARTNIPDRAFTFWLVNAHTDPDEVPQEVSALADVFQIMQSARPDEDDVILLGDLNASESQLGRLGTIPGIQWAVRGVTTNTRQTKAYDNILFHGQATAEFTGRWGVFDLEGTFGLSRDDALKVSDHLPVWAEFQLWEAASQGRFADRLRGNRR
jgi:endonuclease/exonuclease/phosphatase family metal-dependent hydrolase